MSQPSTASLLVLGDSASTQLGGHIPTYVDLIASEWNGDRQLRIHNASSIGLTSADACVVLHDLLGSGSRFDALVVYLGHNDGCGYGYLKPRRLHFGGEGPRLLTRLFHRLNPLSVRTEPFRYEGRAQGRGLLPSVSQSDFGANIDELLSVARRSGIASILVNAVGKADFVPCNNVGNFIFFKCLGVDDIQPYSTDAGSAPLRDALGTHSAGDLDEAELKYRALLGGAADDEVRRIATNNLAAIAFRRGDADDALRLLESIPPAGPIDALVLFNRGLALRSLGRDPEATALLREAHERDLGSYRIRPSYRAAVEAVARRRSGPTVRYLDLATIVSDGDFVDYCHPDIAAHERIARALLPHLRDLMRTSAGSHSGSVTSVPANPDSYAGYHEGFFRYFNVVVEPSAARTGELTEAARSWRDRYPDSLVALSRALGRERGPLTIAAHPLFGLPEFVTASPPKSGLDQGRLPELYFMRHMLPVYAEVSGDVEWLHGLDDVRDFMPAAPRELIAFETADLAGSVPSTAALAAAFATVDPDEVLGRARALARFHLLSEPTVFERYRTITYWFLREALSFGTPSHYSQGFDRSTVLRLIETCAFMLHFSADAKVRERFRALLEHAERVLRLHREFLFTRARAPYAIDPSDLTAHTARLRALIDDPALGA